MYRKNAMTATGFKINNSKNGETIEAKVRRIMNNNEPIHDSAPIVYTERKDGVQPEYNIRTDKFEVALDAMTMVANQHGTNREQSMGERTYDTMTDPQKQEFNTKFPNNKFAAAQKLAQSQEKPNPSA